MKLQVSSPEGYLLLTAPPSSSSLMSWHFVPGSYPAINISNIIVAFPPFAHSPRCRKYRSHCERSCVSFLHGCTVLNSVREFVHLDSLPISCAQPSLQTQP